uniref:Uncharacterized protein n=1 Tax=Anopheles farauti TaxID=69004 RepID=A0A182QEY2_9DIPT
AGTAFTAVVASGAGAVSGTGAASSSDVACGTDSASPECAASAGGASSRAGATSVATTVQSSIPSSSSSDDGMSMATSGDFGGALVFAGGAALVGVLGSSAIPDRRRITTAGVRCGCAAVLRSPDTDSALGRRTLFSSVRGEGRLQFNQLFGPGSVNGQFLLQHRVLLEELQLLLLQGRNSLGQLGYC